jgi:hypothetical protein
VKNDIRKQFIFKPDVQHQARANIEHQVKQYLNKVPTVIMVWLHNEIEHMSTSFDFGSMCIILLPLRCSSRHFKSSVLESYLQSWRYFQLVKNDIRKQFVIKPDAQRQARANSEHQVKQYLNNSENFKDLQIIGSSLHFKPSDSDSVKTRNNVLLYLDLK